MDKNIAAERAWPQAPDSGRVEADSLPCALLPAQHTRGPSFVLYYTWKSSEPTVPWLPPQGCQAQSLRESRL